MLLDIKMTTTTMTMTTMMSMMTTMTMVGCNWPGASVRQLCQVCGSHRLRPPLVWLKTILFLHFSIFFFLLLPPTTHLIGNKTFIKNIFSFFFFLHPFHWKQYFSSRLLQNCISRPPTEYIQVQKPLWAQRWDQIIEETVARDHFALVPPTPVWTFQKIAEAWTLDGVGVVQIRLYSYFPSASHHSTMQCRLFKVCLILKANWVPPTKVYCYQLLISNKFAVPSERFIVTCVDPLVFQGNPLESHVSIPKNMCLVATPAECHMQIGIIGSCPLEKLDLIENSK